MLRSLALALGCATAFSVAAQGLFDDNEARRRVEVLRQAMVANQREVAEQLQKLTEAVAGASDRRALLQLASQLDTLSNELNTSADQIEHAAKGISSTQDALAAMGTVSSTLIKLSTDISTTVTELQGLNVAQGWKQAFANSASCQSLSKS